MTSRMVHTELSVEDIGRVRVLRIVREQKLGALSRGLVEALGRVFEAAGEDSDIGALVLTGTGRGFIAGADIEEYAGADREGFEQYQRQSRAVFDSLASLPMITIAAVNGYAYGGGFEIALCCDVILATEGAKFGLPEVKLGLIPGGGAFERLTQASSRRWARDLIVTGRTVTASEARERGIVAEVVEGDVLARATELAGVWSANAPLAVREAKAVFESSHAEADLRALVSLFESEDAREGIDAFTQKRAAIFRGC